MWNWAITPIQIVFELSLYSLGNPWVQWIMLVPKSQNGQKVLKQWGLQNPTCNQLVRLFKQTDKQTNVIIL